MMFGLAFVLGLASTVFFIWLAVIAFRRSAVWGLVTLLVPLGNVVFAVKHWADSKKPFLAGVACSVLSVLLVVGGMGMGVKQMTDQVMDDPEFRQALREMQAQAEAGTAAEAPVGSAMPAMPAMPAGDGSDANENAATVGDDDSRTVASNETEDDGSVMEIAMEDDASLTPMDPSKRVNRNRIRVRQAADHVGAQMRIVGASNVDTVARLVGVENGTLQFEQDLAGGMVVFEMRENEIASLELLR